MMRMLKVLAVLSVVAPAAAVAAVDVSRQVPLDALLPNVAAGSGLKIGVVMRPAPAGYPAGAPEDIRDSTVTALRGHPGVAAVTVPSSVDDTPDQTLAQEAGGAGMNFIVVITFEQQPMERAVWTVYDPTGKVVVLEERTLAQLTGATATPGAPPTPQPDYVTGDPQDSQPDDRDAPEPVETGSSSSAFANPITWLILGTGFGAGALSGLLTLVLVGTAATIALVGPGVAPDSRNTLTSASQGLLALSFCSACCCFCLPTTSLCAAAFRAVPMTGGPPPNNAGPPPPGQSNTTIIIQQPPPSGGRPYRGDRGYRDDRDDDDGNRYSPPPSSPSTPRRAPSQPNPAHQPSPPPSNHGGQPTPSQQDDEKKKKEKEKERKATPSMDRKVGTPGLKK